MPTSWFTFWPGLFFLGFVTHRVSHHPPEKGFYDAGVFDGSQEVPEIFSLTSGAAESAALIPAPLDAVTVSAMEEGESDFAGTEEAPCLRQRLAPAVAALLRWLEEDCTRTWGRSSAGAAAGLVLLLALVDIAVAVKVACSFVRWLTRPAKSVDASLQARHPRPIPCQQGQPESQRSPLPRPQVFEIHSEGEDAATPRRPKKACELDAARHKVAEQEKELLQQRAVASSLEQELTQQKLAAKALPEELLQQRVRARAGQTAEATQTDAEAVLEAELQVSRKELAEIQVENDSLRATLQDRANEKQALLKDLSDQKAALVDLAGKTQKKLVAAAEEKKELRRELELIKAPRKATSWW